LATTSAQELTFRSELWTLADADGATPCVIVAIAAGEERVAAVETVGTWGAVAGDELVVAL